MGETGAKGGAGGPATGWGRPPTPEGLLGEANDAVLVTEGGPIDEPGPRVVYANAAFSRATGYPPEEIVGRSPRVLQGPGTDRAKLDEIRAALEAGRAVRTELLNYRKDGSPYWVELDIVPVRDDAGRVERWLSVQRETTARVEAEEARLEAERRLRAVLARYGSDMVTILEPDGTPRYESPAVERALGYRHKELAAGDVFRFVHPDDVEKISRSVAEAVSTPGEGPPVEFRMRHADGSWRWFESAKNNLAGDPDVGGIVVITRDVTERKEAERALREAEGRYRLLVEQIPAVTYVDRYVDPRHDSPDEPVYVSPQIEGMLGYAPEEWVGQKLWPERLHPDDRERVLAADERFEGGEEERFSEEYRLFAKDGRTVWVREEAAAVRDQWGQPLFWQGVLLDVTERKAAEETLRRREQDLAEAQRIARLGSWEYDVGRDEARWSDEMYRVFGFAPRSFVPTYKTFLASVHPDDRGKVRGAVRGTLRRGGGGDVEFRVVRPGGGVRVVRGLYEARLGEGGEPNGLAGTVQDVTELRRAEEALKESEGRFRALVQNASDIVTVLDAGGAIRYESPSVERVLGYEPEGLVGKSAFDYVHPEDAERVRWRLRRREAAGAGAGSPVEYRIRHADGSWRWVESVAANLLSDPAVGGIVVNTRDVTERKALEERLEHRALHDHLTGLPNRALLMDRLGHILKRAGRRKRGSSAVLFLDLDNFKYVNDSLGHEAGDRLLVAVAERLRKALRPEDTAARLGGDEFAVLLEGIEDHSQAKRVAGRVIKALRAPFSPGGGREVFVTPSIGIAVGEPGRDSAEDLLRKADVAMYRAKRGGKARHEVFDPVMEAEVLGRLGLEHDLRRALERGEFAVRYQPVVRLGGAREGRPGGTGGWRVAGFEALLRWEHPERGLLAPSEFLPLTEELGLTVPVGRWLLVEACRQTKEWQKRHPHAAPLAVGANLSARQLSHPGLLGDALAAAREAGLSPGQVTLEVTEDAVAGEAGRPVEVLRGLGDAGFLLALGGFGASHSTLSHLRRLPVGLVKVDRSFVEGLGEDGTEEDEVLLSGVVGIAHGLGLLVCAEGVESERQLGRAKALGCDLAQGRLFSGPLEAGEAHALLAGEGTSPGSGHAGA